MKAAFMDMVSGPELQEILPLLGRELITEKIEEGTGQKGEEKWR